ncbi:cyclin-L1-1 isoform X1 [Impatiens glandulifera]|uniref:cyclin-L1-1 isoform X1 n=1 Tax=Impatiens glandulifera TaxID=253017 RepID=UPI001FB0F763|nr:cyclin-L1-1 isoform X1 [Impatiens glandulifera]
MIYTAIDTFYLTDEQLKDSPSRKDNIDEATETTLRIYGCDLIQEGGILLRLPQAVMATGQVLFHRFYCKKSFARFNVKRVAASCLWLASKLEESPRKARYVLMVFHRMECRRENLRVEHLDPFSKKYAELKMNLIRTERHLLKEMGFICHVEHPHKFISNYLATLKTPPELRQEAWNLANDCLRTTLCVRFKSEAVACGVVYAAARRFHVPLPEEPPWWLAFDADKSAIDGVCTVLAHLYTLPKAQYIHVCKDDGSFTTAAAKSWDSPSQLLQKESSPSVVILPLGQAVDAESGGTKDGNVKAAATLDKLKESKKSGDDLESLPSDQPKEEVAFKSKPEFKIEARDRGKERERIKVRERDRGRDSDRERERDDLDREREKMKDRNHRSKDKGKDPGGLAERSRHHSSRDRDYHNSSYSRDKDRHRHH